MKRLLPCTLLCIAVLAAYANAFTGAFQFDDLGSIVNNPAIQRLDPAGIWAAFPFRFVGYLTFALNYHFSGLDPVPFHTVNILIHLGAACAALQLAQLTLRRAAAIGASPLQGRAADAAAFTAALFFALHPVQTQAVTYIVQRLASLAALWYLGCLALYVSGRMKLSAGECGATPRLVAAALFGALALLTKQNAFTLPLMLLLFEFALFPGGGERRRRSALLAGLLAVSAVALTAVWLGHGGLSEELSEFSRETALLGRVDYLLAQVNVVRDYFRLLFWPAGQRLEYVVAIPGSPFELPTLLSLLLHASLAAAAILCWKRWRAVSIGIAFCFIALLIESSVFPIKDLMNEHRLYLPAFGIFLAAAAALWSAAERWRIPLRATAAFVLLLAVLLGVLTHQRNRVWQTPIALWSDAAAKEPGSWRARYNLGKALEETGDLKAARREYEASAQLAATPLAWNNLGNALLMEGDAEGAIQAYQRAIALSPADGEAHSNLGVAYERRAQPLRAAEEYRKALALDASLATPYLRLGALMAAEGRHADAVELVQQGLKRVPAGAPAYGRMQKLLNELASAAKPPPARTSR